MLEYTRLWRNFWTSKGSVLETLFVYESEKHGKYIAWSRQSGLARDTKIGILIWKVAIAICNLLVRTYLRLRSASVVSVSFINLSVTRQRSSFAYQVHVERTRRLRKEDRCIRIRKENSIRLSDALVSQVFVSITDACIRPNTFFFSFVIQLRIRYSLARIHSSLMEVRSEERNTTNTLLVSSWHFYFLVRDLIEISHWEFARPPSNKNRGRIVREAKGCTVRIEGIDERWFASKVLMSFQGIAVAEIGVRRVGRGELPRRVTLLARLS